jgi:ABC-type multidrug transport system ATPase subunit
MGKTIVASIHQPRTAIFDKFDKVCLLSEGRQMFFGDPAEAVRWFGQIGYFFPAQNAEGLSDWLLDLISIGFHKPSQAGRWGHFVSHAMNGKAGYKTSKLTAIICETSPTTAADRTAFFITLCGVSSSATFIP